MVGFLAHTRTQIGAQSITAIDKGLRQQAVYLRKTRADYA